MTDNLVILGSSRSKGNTHDAVTQIFDGIDHHFIDLAPLTISHYDYAHSNQADDFLEIAQQMNKHKHIFFYTPVYWYSMSAIMKIFFDRLSDLLTIQKPLGRGLAGRKVYIRASGTDEVLPECFIQPIKRTCDYFEMEYVRSIYYYTGKNALLAQQNTPQILIFQQAVWGTFPA
ncbi:MAG: flavodoxin family protein [Alphaproteobacteria bacterium]